MKNIIILIVSMCICWGGKGYSEAISWTAEDMYIGGGWQETNSQYIFKEKDVIALSSSDINNYDIDAMTVIFGQDSLIVNIQTDYQEGEDSFKTLNGDLFISNTGWNPYGNQPYEKDNFDNGTLWDYAFDVSEGNLYSIKNSQDRILLSDDIGKNQGWNDSWYRHDQEVLIDSTKLNPLASGRTWNWQDDFGTNYFSVAIDISNLNFDPNALAFHWTMTCANDVIEYGSTVPEPATFLLVGLGLIALAKLRKKYA